MRTRVYKLYATGGASVNAIAQLTIQRPGVITCISGKMSVDSVTDNSQFVAELSFAAAAQVTTNDTQGALCELRAFFDLLTSGVACPATDSVLVSGIAIPVNAADRLYMHHVLGAGTMVAYASFYIYVAEA